MFSFVSWNLIGSSAMVLKEQGVNVLLNLFFGAAVNAARGIAYQDRHNIILVGRDTYGRYAESYLRNFMMYPSVVTAEQCLFLNGEEGNE
jgi:sugar/nucleoside kinase (ribokinase family)